MSLSSMTAPVSPARLATASAWLPFGTEITETPQLFCFPNSGANATSYREWLEPSNADLTIRPVQLPGRGERMRDTAFTHIDGLIDALVVELEHQFTGRYALFGHSVGALIVFELARAIRSRNLPMPAHLFVSGRMAPALPRRSRTLHTLPTDELVPELRRIGGTPESVLQAPMLLEMFLPTLRADFAINETYQYRPEDPLDIPITAFGGYDDSRATAEELLAWEHETTLGFTRMMFEGGHFFLHDHRDALISAMARDLA